MTQSGPIDARLPMTLLGHGIDLVENQRFEHVLNRHGQRFLDRVFTAGEQQYCEAAGRRIERYAARFAAKEAVLKAIGTGWRDGIAWTDVEVVNLPSGRPVVKVTGRCQQLALDCGIDAWMLSLTHVAGHSMASVLAGSSARQP